MNTHSPPVKLTESQTRNRSRSRYWIKYWQIYAMIIPGFIYFILFKYIPISGSIIAFQDYNLYTGIWKSPFVGFKHFETLFTYPEFLNILTNTILISMYQLVFGFPAPVLLAILLNEVRKMWFKRSIQTIMYLPHFLSWVIVGVWSLMSCLRIMALLTICLIFLDLSASFYAKA